MTLYNDDIQRIIKAVEKTADAISRYVDKQPDRSGDKYDIVVNVNAETPPVSTIVSGIRTALNNVKGVQDR